MPLVRDVFEYMQAHKIALPEPVDLPTDYGLGIQALTIYKTLFKRTYSAIFFCRRVLALYYEPSPSANNAMPTAVHDLATLIASIHPIRSLDWTRAKIARGSKEKGLLWYLPDLAVAYNKKANPPMFGNNNFMLQYLSVIIFIIREIHQCNEGIEWADHGLNTAIIERSIGVEYAKSRTEDIIESSALAKESPHIILKNFFGRDLGSHGELLLESAVKKGIASTLVKTEVDSTPTSD